MRYIDRRFLFPVAAATAWAQQPSPAAAEAEAALRARAEQFFQFQADKKFRQGEALVADDSKDNYYNGNRFNIKSFTIQKIELLDDNTRAQVVIKSRLTVITPIAGPVDLDSVATTLWKLENGQWVWYIEHEPVVQTPFGSVKTQEGKGAAPPAAKPGRAPDISVLRSLVKIDRNAVILTAEAPQQTVTVSNGLPGGVDLELHGRAAGFRAEMEKKHLEAGETTLIRFTATGGSTGGGVVQVLTSPIDTELDIRVTIK
jgi:hypothetical protein